MFNRRAKGKQAELIAACFLEQRGFKIVEHNFATREGEIDLIAVDKNDVWHFIEVKSKQINSLYGVPEEAITDLKIARIEKTVAAYLDQKKLTDAKIKLEAVVILTDYRDKPLRIKILSFG
jgi:putative endonuclease